MQTSATDLIEAETPKDDTPHHAKGGVGKGGRGKGCTYWKQGWDWV